MNDIIVGLATSSNRNAINIIRVSGKNSINILEKIFLPSKVKKFKTFRMRYGKVVDNFDNILDEVIVTTMLAPKTYTKEDMFEISCHGNSIITNNLVSPLSENVAKRLNSNWKTALHQEE